MTEPQPPAISYQAAEPAEFAGGKRDAAADTRRLWRQPLFWLAGAGIALAAWQWVETRQRLLDIQVEVTRRLGEDADAVREARVLSKQVQDTAATLQTRFGVVESRLGEIQNQQAALAALYQDLARGRDEWMLVEVEQLIAVAAQQLQLAGNVPAALQALNSADERLARGEKPHLVPLRKILARDMARLRGLPQVDVAGISVRLEGVVGAADTLPLAFEERPRAEAAAKVVARPAARPGDLSAALAAIGAWWQQLGDDVWREFRSLVRIERLDRPEPVLLAPRQVFFLRENLKLRLLNARLALLGRDQETFRGEVRQALNGLERHFDGGNAAVQAAVATLRQLAAASLVLELPSLGDAQAALQAARPARSGKGGA